MYDPHADAPIILNGVPHSATSSLAMLTSRQKMRMAMIMTNSMTKIRYQKAVRKKGGGMTTPAFNVIPASTEGHSDEGRPGY
jgi:hypothetical protein